MPELKLAKVIDTNPKKPVFTVVMLHGIAADAHTFDSTLKYLAAQRSLKKVRFLTFDLLGVGASPSGDDLEYTTDEYATALRNSIKDITTPVVLVGHSMGAIIAVCYAKKYPVKELVLISAPFYTKEDFSNHAHALNAGVEMFKELAALRYDRKLLKAKSFHSSIDNVVLNPDNYQALVDLKTPTTILYGKLDQFILVKNLKSAQSLNPKNITLIQTSGRHGVTRDKYVELAKIIKELKNVKAV